MGWSVTILDRKHRLYIGNNSSKYRPQLEAILQNLQILHTLKWRTRHDIVLQVEDALLAAVREWFNFVLDKIPTMEKAISQGYQTAFLLILAGPGNPEALIKTMRLDGHHLWNVAQAGDLS